jgi:hypothetical protein
MKRRGKKKTPSKEDVPYCDWQGKYLKPAKVSDKSTIYRYKKGGYTGYTWRGTCSIL